MLTLQPKQLTISVFIFIFAFFCSALPVCPPYFFKWSNCLLFLFPLPLHFYHSLVFVFFLFPSLQLFLSQLAFPVLFFSCDTHCCWSQLPPEQACSITWYHLWLSAFSHDVAALVCSAKQGLFHVFSQTTQTAVTAVAVSLVTHVSCL